MLIPLLIAILILAAVLVVSWYALRGVNAVLLWQAMRGRKD